MDKFNKSEYVKQFLRGLGLHVDEDVVRQVVSVLTGETSQSLYSLYTTRPDRPPPVCGKGTAYKVKRLYDAGKLEPCLAYLSDLQTFGKANTEQIEEAEHEAPQKARTEQKPYEETPHKKKMRKLAKELVKIGLPSVMDSFRVWGIKPASYSLLCNDDVFFVIEAENREIAAFADLDGLESTDLETTEANYTWKALFAHLKTGGFMGVVDMIKPFKQKMYVHFERCYEFVELVKRRIEDETCSVIQSNHFAQLGFTPSFAMLVCADAVLTDSDISFIKDTSYGTEPMGNRWALTCNGQVIFISDIKETLSNYEKMHKDLRLKWIDAAKTEKTKAVIEIRKGLENTVSEVRKGLLTFAGIEILPGHCELC